LNMNRKITRAQLEGIFSDDNSDWDGDNAWQGLQILAKYVNPMKTDLIAGADHDVIYSVNVDEVLNAGLTEEDAKALRKLNWMIDEDGECFACFV